MRTGIRVGVIAVLAAGLAVQVYIRNGSGSPVADLPEMEVRERGDSVPDVDLRVTSDRQELGLWEMAQIEQNECLYLYFFSTECPACQDAVKDWAGLNSLHGARVVWVSLFDEPDEAEKFMKEHDLSMPAAAISSELGFQRLGVAATPSMWKVESGTIADVFVGRSDTHPQMHLSSACEAGGSRS